ncbi:MAG: thymidylate synthase [Candidatus Nealsonbacteria bacterium]
MVRLIEADNISEAWLKGCECIINYGFRTKRKIKLHNLIAEIKNITLDKYIDEQFRNYMNLRIFKRTLDIVSSDQNLNSHPNYWRRLKGKEEFKIDQVARVISRLRKQPHSTKLTLCIYSPNDFKKMYTPCILCAELRVNKRRLNMTAFIRSQDFANKSYADYIGLSSILKRIGENSNIKPGAILTHTITAFIAYKDLSRMKSFLNIIREKKISN